jgi:hypothetical protein
MPRTQLGAKFPEGRKRIWRAIRMQREGFSLREIMALAGAKRPAASKYVAGLSHGGYLRSEGRARARRYFLLRDSGPFPPRVGRAAHGVALDPNLEIERLRKRHSELVQEIRAIEAGLARFGAYVSRFEPEIEAGHQR